MEPHAPRPSSSPREGGLGHVLPRVWHCDPVLLTRRDVLAAAGLGLTAACTSGAHLTPTPVVDPDGALHTAALAREAALLAAYDDVLTTTPSLAARLSAVRAEHAEHLAALQALRPTPSPVRSPSTPGAPSPVPRTSDRTDPATAVLRLTSLERTSAATHASAAAAASRRLAPLLASLAASESSHAAVL